MNWLASALLLLLLALLSLSGVCSQGSSLRHSVESKDFVVKVYQSNSDGHLSFHYYDSSNQTFLYVVGVKGLWESADGDLSTPVAGSQLPLNEFSVRNGSVINNTSFFSIHFENLPQNRVARGLCFDVAVPLGESDLKKSVAAASVDVKIQGYKWINGNSSTQLVFTWFVDYSDTFGPNAVSNLTLKVKSGKTVDFGGAYFAINTTANSGNDTLDVRMAVASDYSDATADQRSVYVVYKFFESGDLEHDPEFGFGSGPGSNLLWIVIIVVVILAILVIILIAVNGFILVRRRRKAYDTF